MKIFGLHMADAVAVVAYLAGITWLGMYMGKTVHSTTDFFVAGRRFGRLLATFFSFGAGTHADQAVTVAAKTYTSGLSGIWYQWMWLPITPFYVYTSLINRRCRCLTLGDFFETRYSRGVALISVVVSTALLMVSTGTMLKSSGAIIGAISEEISPNAAIAIMTILFVAYGVVGGLAAAVVTDFVQGLLMILFSFMLLPVALHALGGLGQFHEKVAATFAAHPPPGMNSPEEMWSLVAPGEITLFYIIVVTLNGLIGIVAQPGGVPGCNANRNESVAIFGMVAGTIIKRICTVAWCLTGLCAFVLFPGMTERAEIDKSFGLIAGAYLPAIMPGLIGVFIASLMASIMACCNAQMLIASGLFTQNIYRPWTGNRHPDSHYVFVGRLASALVVAGGVLFAYSFESVLAGLELFWKIPALMGIAFWGGLFWRRATSAGAWASVIASFAVFMFTTDIAIGEYTLWSFNSRFAAALPDWMLWNGQLYLPWQMILYLAAGIVAFIVVSLVTPREDNDRLERFYGVLRTPVVRGEVIEKPFHLPAGVAYAPRRVLIDHPDWEIPVPSRRGLFQFIFVSVLCAMLVVGLHLTVRLIASL